MKLKFFQTVRSQKSPANFIPAKLYAYEHMPELLRLAHQALAAQAVIEAKLTAALERVAELEKIAALMARALNYLEYADDGDEACPQVWPSRDFVSEVLAAYSMAQPPKHPEDTPRKDEK